VTIGYVGLQRENLNPTDKKGDFKEAFNIVGNNNRFLTGPKELKDMKEITEQFYQCASNASLVILEAYALALKLPRDYFRKNHFTNQSGTTLRLLHYPEYELDSAEGQMRAGAHTDYGSITLLWQDGVGGLQLFDKLKGEWREVEPVSGATCIVNTGDLLRRWTNDLFMSTNHCVKAPHQSTNKVPERYSMAFFVHPSDETIVACLPACMKSDKATYPPISAGNYLKQRLLDTY